MASLANLNSISQTQSLKLKSSKVETTSRKLTVETVHDQKQPTRRVLLGLSAIALSLQSATKKTLAEDNGYWVTGLLPLPIVTSKIANEETGTRSFLKKGIFVANVGPEASAYRLRKGAFELLGLGDIITQDAWHYVRKYLRLKSSIMYYDFDTVISAAPENDKGPLTNLANRLFDSVEKLEDAVKLHSLPQAESCYQDTTTILQEVMERFA
ncbi:hypothetical protein ACHQM5_003774 [Ranunculus cassubicifolius]